MIYHLMTLFFILADKQYKPEAANMKTRQERKQITINDIKANPERIKATEQVFLNMARVETIKPIVTRYQKVILQAHQFHADNSKEYLKYRNEITSIILKPEQTYLLNDVDFKTYLQEVHEQHIKHGFNVPFEYCPLLIAQSKLSDSENKLMSLYTKTLGITLSDVNMSLDRRKRFLDIILNNMAQYINIKKALKEERIKTEQFFKENGGY